MASPFQRVSARRNTRLRIAIDGVSGAGKTYTALRFAHCLQQAVGGEIAIIDTEHDSAHESYAGLAPDGIPWSWLGCPLTHDAPSTYVSMIESAARDGTGILIIDSLSHAWNGKHGAIAQVDQAASREKNSLGKFGAWRTVTPQHNALVDAILSYPGHVICTMRSKTEYVVEDKGNGKASVTKLGLKPIQRDGVEYEFTSVWDMEIGNTLVVSKSRCDRISGDVVRQPGPEWFQKIIGWVMESKNGQERIQPVGIPEGSPPVPHQPALVSHVQGGSHGQASQSVAVEGPADEGTTEACQKEIKDLWSKLGKTPEEFSNRLAVMGIASLSEMKRRDSESLRDYLQGEVTKFEAKSAF